MEQIVGRYYSNDRSTGDYVSLSVYYLILKSRINYLSHFVKERYFFIGKTVKMKGRVTYRRCYRDTLRNLREILRNLWVWLET